MITGIQILGMLFGLFMLYMTFIYHKRKEFKTTEWGFWSILWIAFMGIAILPNSLDFLVKGVLKMQRPLDFFIILGFMFLIGVSFYTYSMMKKTQKKMEDLVRNVALREKK